MYANKKNPYQTVTGNILFKKYKSRFVLSYLFFHLKKIKIKMTMRFTTKTKDNIMFCTETRAHKLKIEPNRFTFLNELSIVVMVVDGGEWKK